MHPPGEQDGGRRLALIIATSRYADPTLTGLRAPGEDARDLAEVLGDKAIGGYEVETVIDAVADTIRRRVAEFCARGGPRDLALIYLSCHGVLDDRGHLHYAATDTERKLLEVTAVEASWLNRRLEACRCRRQVLILDCCHSGAFARGARGSSELALRDHFPEARGRVVLTASRATEYAFEGDRVTGEGAAGLFTGALVDGMRSGDADRDGDGDITVTELFDYADEAVRARDGRQRPGLWVDGGEGRLVVARSHRGPRRRPLPDDLMAAIESARPPVRIGAVAALADVLTGEPGRALTARDWLERMAAEDIPSVARAAREVLRLDEGAVERAAPPTPPPPPPPDGALPSPAPREAVGATRFRVAAIAGVLALSVAGALFVAIDGGAPEPGVTVGAIYSLTGTDSELGKGVLEGVRLAVDYVNDGGFPRSGMALAPGAGLPRLKGAKLKLVVTDVAGSRCSVEPAFDELVDRDGAAAVVGAGQSTFTRQALQAADRSRVPLVTDASTASSLTDDDGRTRRPPKSECGNDPDLTPSDWFFRVGPSDEQAADAFFTVIDDVDRRRGPDVRKVAILHESNDIFGNGGAADTRRIAVQNGLRAEDVRDFPYRTVVGSSAPEGPLTCADATEQAVIDELSAQVRAIQDYAPDVVFALSYEPDAMAVVQTMQQLGYVPPALLAYGSGYSTETFIESVQKPNDECGLPAADPAGIIVRTSGSPGASAREPTRSVAKAFEERHDRPMNSRSAVGFTAMMTLAQAINEAGSDDPALIRTALDDLVVPAGASILPGRGIRFDDYGQNEEAQVLLQQIVNEKLVVVHPRTKSTPRAIWPLAKARR